MMTCGEAVLELLEKYEIDTVFGIPGVHNVELYRGFDKSSIRHITPRHEQGAAFMAQGYALATGRPAACFLISGPGVINAATAMGQAYSDSLPMLVFASNNQLVELGTGRGYLHESKNQMAVEEQVTGFSHQLLDPANLPEVMARAMARFESGRPRPICIEVPRDVLAKPINYSIKAQKPPSRIQPSMSAVTTAAQMLQGAKSAVLILGGGAWQASEYATQLIELLDIPVISTCAGKGIVDESHPLSLGCTLPFKPIQDLIGSADVVLAIGSELSETDQLYTYSRFPLNGSLIRVDIETDQLYRNYEPTLPILGDAEATLLALCNALEQHVPVSKDQSCREQVARLLKEIDPYWQPLATSHKPVLDLVRDILPVDGILSTESNKPGYTSKHYYKCHQPRTLLYPNGFGTLGTALPTAIGAKIGAPDRSVACIAGDGGVLFSIGELATAVEEKLPLPVIIWNNHAYGEIRDSMVNWGLPRVGVELKTPDFVKLAEGFGCAGSRPGSLDELGEALRRGLKTDRPTVLEIEAEAPWLSG